MKEKYYKAHQQCPICDLDTSYNHSISCPHHPDNIKKEEKYYLFERVPDYGWVQINRFNTLHGIQSYFNIMVEDNYFNNRHKYQIIKGIEIPVRKGFIIEEK